MLALAAVSVATTITATVGSTPAFAAGGTSMATAVALSNSPVQASDAWRSYVLGNDASTAKPVAVATTSGNVTNAEALVTGDGTATFTNVAGQAPPTVVLDYGKEVGGLPFFNVSSANPAPPSTSVTMRAGY